MSPSSLSRANHTMREIVADGAEMGTFKYPEKKTIHAYVALGRQGDIPYIACGLHGLILWRKHYPETMDCHGGTSAVTCGRCRRVLGDALDAS